MCRASSEWLNERALKDLSRQFSAGLRVFPGIERQRPSLAPLTSSGLVAVEDAQTVISSRG